MPPEPPFLYQAFAVTSHTRFQFFTRPTQWLAGWLLDRIKVLRNNWEGDSPILSYSETVYASKSKMKANATELLKKVSKQVAVEYLAANLPDQSGSVVLRR